MSARAFGLSWLRRYRDYQNYNTGLILDEAGKVKFEKARNEFIKGITFKTKKPQLPGEDKDEGFLIRAILTTSR